MPEKQPLPQSALELIDFPSRFPLKVFGTKNQKLEVNILSLVKAHCPVDEKIEISSRESKNGKYTALTLTFTASSKRQLEDIYQDLYDCDQVVMTL
ncbi:MAG: putative lipoic acid-binding regulatory protein [Candidatus Azotimanducaceae bacterium]|jgi:putative lipoic acid-binding regulatory protein